jgi:hypothetical protein
MANKRTKDLDVQATRLPELLISVDKASGFTEKKVIRADVLAPKIDELTSSAPSNRATSIMKWNDGSGNEYYTAINNIYKLTKDLSWASGLSGTTKFRVDVGGTEYYATGVVVAEYIAATTEIDTKIDTVITTLQESYNISLHDAGGVSTFGTLKLRRFWKLVTGVLEVGSVESLFVTSSDVLPESLRPAVDEMFTRPSYLTGDENHIAFLTDGTIQFRIDTASGETGNYPNIPISYCIE